MPWFRSTLNFLVIGRATLLELAPENPWRRSLKRRRPSSSFPRACPKWRCEERDEPMIWKGSSAMTATISDWKTKEGLAAGKGATVQEFVAMLGDKTLEIDVAPWGEGHLKVNGREVAHISDAKDRRQAFRELKKIAERYAEGRPVDSGSKSRGKSSMIPTVKARLLAGKSGLVVG